MSGYHPRIVVFVLSAAIAVLFGLRPGMLNEIVTTDLFPPELGAGIGLVILAFSVLCMLFSLFHEKIRPKRISGLSVHLLGLSVTSLVLLIFLANFSMKFALSFLVPPGFQAHDGAHYSSIAYNIYSGKGYTTSTLWAVMLQPDRIPFEDTYRAPMVPYTIALFYHLFGVSFFAEKLVFTLFSSLIPAIAFLVFYRITRSKKLSLVSSVLLTFDWIIFAGTRFVHTEIPLIAFSLLFFLFLFRFRGRKSDYFLVALFFAASYLTRYQYLVIFPPVILAYVVLHMRSLKKAAVYSAVILAVFLVMVSPWLARNYSLKNDLFYSDLKYIVVEDAYHRPDYDAISLDTVPESVFSFAARNPAEMASKFYSNLGTVLYMPVLVFSSPVFAALALIGILCCREFLKKKHALTLLLYIAITGVFVLATYGYARYFMPLIPFLVLFAAAGLMKVYGLLKNYNAFYGRIFILLALLAVAINVTIIAFAYQGLEARGQGSKETYKLSAYLKSVENATFMVDSYPYFYEYYTRGRINVVQFPYYSEEQDLYDYMKKYNVSYIAMDKGSSAHSIPGSLNTTVVFENSGSVVYKIGRV